MKMMDTLKLLFLWAMLSSSINLATSAGSCSPNEYTCKNDQCVHMAWRCDGGEDCDDGSDEFNCPSVTCTGNSFRCDDGQCISSSWVCDGHPECRDSSDEKGENCRESATETNHTADTSSPECSRISFQCDDGQCITASWVCDEQNDCEDGSDEKHEKCQNISCDGFKCKDTGRCIPEDWRCDGTDDCEDGSDEKECSSQPPCNEAEFMCKNKECISLEWRCNQLKDCADGSDEENCGKLGCKDGQFVCNDGICINDMWKCDGDSDCEDGSDESNCTYPGTATCESMEFRCVTPLIEAECIHMSWKCDGDTDCADGSDEAKCEDRTCAPDEVMCDDQKYCIKELLLCDQQFDCHDKSDEKNCTYPVPTCDADKFDCYKNGSKCISRSLVCDGRPDCHNAEDEAKELNCPISSENPCKKNNGDCQQACIINATSPKDFTCDCFSGFEQVNGVCKDINECDFTGTCSQICRNTVGSYKCECQAGYALFHNRYCKATVGHPVELFLSDATELRRYRLDTYHYTLLVDSESNPSGAVALDFDIRQDMIYWTGAKPKKIYRTKIQSGKVQEIISDEEGNPTGIAVDWVHHNLYITGSDTISVSKLDGTHRHTLVSGGTDEPRSLVLDPYEGWMYWTDSGFAPKIEKCGMNGLHRRVIRDKHIIWPNGLTIDYVGNRLYWVDAKIHIIASSDLDGNDYRIIHKGHESLGHPHSITVFEDFLYWSDWIDNAVNKINKFGNGAVTTIASNLKTPYDIRVYHIYRQPPAKNFCNENVKCSHLCLPTPKITGNGSQRRSECACPDGLKLIDSFTCSSTNAPVCGKGKFDCFHNGTLCIEDTKVCNKVQDCPNNADEAEEKCKSEPSISTATAAATTEATTEVTNVSATELGHGSEEKGMGKIFVIVIPAVIAITILLALVVFLLMRRYRKKNKNSMNFDNPVYRKTTTDEQLIMGKDAQSNHRQESMQPLNEEPEIV